MAGTWYPSTGLETEPEVMGTLDRDLAADVDWETAIHELAAEGNVEALEALREQLIPLDYDELGWGD